MTITARGNTVCILVRRFNRNAKNEIWENFTPIQQKSPNDDEIFNAMESDGLKLGEWVTVSDSFESDWPFAKRYPGPEHDPFKTGLRLTTCLEHPF